MRRLIVATALVLGAAGCKKTLHFRVVEDEILLKLGQDAKIERVTCAESEVETGDRFACHLAYKDGGGDDVHVELVDQAGSWKMIEMYVPASRAAGLIHDKLKSDNQVLATVDCGKDLLLTGHHSCSAHDAAGQSVAIDFELTADGGYKWHALH